MYASWSIEEAQDRTLWRISIEQIISGSEHLTTTLVDYDVNRAQIQSKVRALMTDELSAALNFPGEGPVGVVLSPAPLLVVSAIIFAGR